MEQLEGWLKKSNLKGFLLMVSELVEYRFDDSDWDAVQAGLGASNPGLGWFDYPLIGLVSVRVEISRSEEEGDVDIKISVPEQESCLRERIRAVWMVFNRLDVSPDVQLID